MFSCGRLLVMVLVFSCAVSHGQEPVALDTLEVQGTDDNWADSIASEDAYGSVTEISADEFRHGAGTLSDVLKKHTFMTLRQAGGLGSVSAFSVRGASSKQTLVLVDGMVVNNPMFGGVDLNQFTLGNIDRITLYSDVAPAIVSQGAIGGVIALETAKDDREETRVTLGAGSFGTYKGSLNSSFNLGSTHHSFSYFRQGADNDYPYPNHRDWWNPNDGSTSYKRNANFEEEQFSLKSRYRLGAQGAVDLLLEKQSQARGVPSVQNWANNQSRIEGEHQRVQLQVRHQFMDNQLHMSQRLLGSWLDERYDNRWGFVGVGSQHIDTDYTQQGWSQAWVWVGDSALYTLASDISRYRFFQRNLLMGGAPEDGRLRNQYSAALSHEKFFYDGKLSVLSSLRWMAFRDSSLHVGLGGGVSGDQSSRDDFWYGSISTRYRLDSGHVVNLFWSKDIRLATLQEKFGQWGSFVGNEDLEAEKSTQVGLGLSRKKTRQTYQLHLFKRWLDPGFVAIYDTRGVGRYMPMQAEYRGLEWQHKLKLFAGFSIAHSIARLHTENTSRTQTYVRGKPVAGVYHWRFSVTPRYENRRFYAEVSYRVDDDMYYDPANLLLADAREVIDAELGFNMGENARVALKITNIAGKHFQDFNRYPSPGRQGFLSFSMTL